ILIAGAVATVLQAQRWTQTHVRDSMPAFS
ncbi:MAG: hypothetical protein QOC71_1068, partial [Thermoplasmata archaeon]|nr:hypothetical protein [Thermoplasmata archaeon]